MNRRYWNWSQQELTERIENFQAAQQSNPNPLREHAIGVMQETLQLKLSIDSTPEGR